MMPDEPPNAPYEGKTLIAVPGIATLGRRERKLLVDIGARNNWDVDYLAAAISHESGWRPTAYNEITDATGIIQWIPSTAVSLGTTVAKIARMSVYEQLPLVERYFQRASYRRGIQPTDFLVYGLGAAACLPELDADCILYPKGSAGARANPQFTGADGAIHVGRMRSELASFVGQYRAKPRLPVILEREWATTGGPTPETRLVWLTYVLGAAFLGGVAYAVLRVVRRR